MKFAKRLSLFLLLCITFSCTNNRVEAVVPQIIPMPLSETILEGEFIFSSETQIVSNESFKISTRFLTEYLSDFNLKASEAEVNINTIQFIKDETILNTEGYTLDISTETIKISAKTDQGAFYAVQSLRQLLPESLEIGNATEKQFAIQCLKIEDEPQFKYRGMHLDVGRHLFSTDFIKKYIDALAMLKMNTFHWHLTEDQGWRIEIKKYPRLTEVAAFRDETLIGHYNTQPQLFDGKRYGGFYTQEQIKEIVKYANNRNVTIIPEIEMPGHSQAAIAAYPELGCTGEQVKVAQKGGVFEAIYCSKDETFNFIEDVLDEVMELFPSEYIHIGGDEAPKTRWKSCGKCQKRIKDEGLKDEHELQSYFISRVEKYLNSKGRQIIGWDEILEGGLAPNATVMSWRGFNGAIEAAKQHHNVILTPGSHCYFDHYQSENEEEPLAIGGFLPLEKVYSLNPIPEELTQEEAKYVLGAQGNVWTEYMPTSQKVEYMVFPRILALSEVVWSNPENKNYNNFVSRVENFHKRLDVLDINYANHLYEIEGEVVSKETNIFYKMKTVSKGKIIRYTLDGSEPTLKSDIYNTAIPITNKVTIKASVFHNNEKLGKTFSQKINLHKAVGKQITINKALNSSYPGSGANGLINGIKGSNSRYGDKEWLGFSGEDLEITIDLGEKTNVKSIKTRFHNGNGQWIYAPKKVEFWFDVNDRIPSAVLLNSDEMLVNIRLEKEVNTRYITLKIPNFGIIPEGKQGAGHKAWTFIDEIIVK
ncbi:glycoside hydrolase family 20 protein [Lacinutrix jangbogonensis]|uniref:glycoside hydrolase family 20 protein n=1 Tax=Lacinutrix jangbogonensis TaxID=1469557 RepID=UPI00053F0C1E|nr:family 20 glycosylhydrolase [Lacinutrix jangbogonensis]